MPTLRSQTRDITREEAIKALKSNRNKQCSITETQRRVLRERREVEAREVHCYRDTEGGRARTGPCL